MHIRMYRFHGCARIPDEHVRGSRAREQQAAVLGVPPHGGDRAGVSNGLSVTPAWPFKFKEK